MEYPKILNALQARQLRRNCAIPIMVLAYAGIVVACRRPPPAHRDERREPGKKQSPPPPHEGRGWGRGTCRFDPSPPPPSLKGWGSAFSPRRSGCFIHGGSAAGRWSTRIDGESTSASQRRTALLAQLTNSYVRFRVTDVRCVMIRAGGPSATPRQNRRSRRWSIVDAA